MSVHQWLVDIEEKLPGGGTVERRKSRKSSSNRTDNLGPSPNQDSRITNSPADVASRVVRGSVGRGTQNCFPRRSDEPTDRPTGPGL